MKELEPPNDIEIKSAPKIFCQEDIDRIFDKITENTEILIIQNEKPKYGYHTTNPNGININFYNHVLEGSINLSLLPKKMPHLKSISIQHIPLNSLRGLPSELPSLIGFGINHCPLQSLRFLPDSLPNLTFFAITSCDLTNLKHFPQNTLVLKEIWLHHNQITSLKGLPPELPKLKDFNVNHNNLTSLKHLPKMNTKYIWVENNPFRTLFNLSEELIERFIDSSYQKSFNLSPRGIQLINEYRVPFIDEFENKAFRVYPDVLKNKIMKFYSKPLSEIAEKYVRNSNTITADELDRLIWEADLEDRKFLEANLPNTDSVLRKINQRLSIKLQSNFTLLK